MHRFAILVFALLSVPAIAGEQTPPVEEAGLQNIAITNAKFRINKQALGNKTISFDIKNGS